MLRGASRRILAGLASRLVKMATPDVAPAAAAVTISPALQSGGAKVPAVSEAMPATVAMAGAATPLMEAAGQAQAEQGPEEGDARDKSRVEVTEAREVTRSENGEQDESKKRRPPKQRTPQQQRGQREADASGEPLITPVGDIWPRPYYFEDDLRRVRPYHFTYNTYCKERWRGRTLIDIFESEFRDRPAAYYRHSMTSGEIYVNGRRVGPDYVVRNGDMISHTLHRHEPPVTADPVAVIHEDDDMIVINKPAGVPVHPAGRYNFNSVVEIIRAERGRHFLPHPCNRLDRLTSGIMFIAKNVKAAEALVDKIKERSVRKEYLARVVGRFPDGEVVCDQPILQISPKLGLNRVRANGKTAKTVFKRLAYYPPPGDAERRQTNSNTQEPSISNPNSNPNQNPDAACGENPPAPAGAGNEEPSTDTEHRPWLKKPGYSIVRCLPVTGRTHQIRVHLQFLGHPIQNDPIYANQRVWGFNLGQSDADGSENTDEDVISRLSRMGKEEVASAIVYYDEMIDKYEKRRAEKMTGELCDLCQTPLYSDPGPHELSLWLHSLRYEDAHGKWSYVSGLPSWALPPEGMTGPTTVGGLDELVEAAVHDGIAEAEALRA